MAKTTQPTTKTVPVIVQDCDPQILQADAPQAPRGKLGLLIKLLRSPDGAKVDQMMATTGWQAHSVRGAISGALKKKLGLTITSEKVDGTRVYRIATPVA